MDDATLRRTAVGPLIEDRIFNTLDAYDRPGVPPGLMAAMTYAVIPGGARIRPRLCLAVFQACGGQSLAAALDVAAALELIHCASLVHDDMPAFDDANIRRGKPSVHVTFGDATALLAGDALIIAAFETLAAPAVAASPYLAEIIRAFSAGVGMPHGICAGQAWECEDYPDLEAYHAAKTGSLFACVAELGALTAGFTETAGWRHFGMALGSAYQIADDIRDVCQNPEDLGKPAGQDQRLGRPNIALMQGKQEAVRTLTRRVDEALDHVPSCPGRAAFCALARETVHQFLPDSIWELAR